MVKLKTDILTTYNVLAIIEKSLTASWDRDWHRPRSLTSVSDFIIMVTTSWNCHFRGHLIITPSLGPHHQEGTPKMLLRTIEFCPFCNSKIMFKIPTHKKKYDSRDQKMYKLFWDYFLLIKCVKAVSKTVFWLNQTHQQYFFLLFASYQATPSRVPEPYRVAWPVCFHNTLPATAY